MSDVGSSSPLPPESLHCEHCWLPSSQTHHELDHTDSRCQTWLTLLWILKWSEINKIELNKRRHDSIFSHLTIVKIQTETQLQTQSKKGWCLRDELTRNGFVVQIYYVDLKLIYSPVPLNQSSQICGPDLFTPSILSNKTILSKLPPPTGIIPV